MVGIMKTRKTDPILQTTGIFLRALTERQVSSGILEGIRRNGVLKVGTPADYLPFSYGDGGILEGVDIDAAKAFGLFLGVDVVFVPTTWKTLMEDLLEERFHLGVGGIAISKERRKKALFSATYFRTGKAPIAARDRAHMFGSLSDIDRPGVRVIVNPGGTNEAFARKRLRNASIMVHSDNLTVFDMIIRGEADLMITDAIETLVWEKRCPELKAINPHRPFTCARFAWMLGPEEKDFKTILDRWMVSYCARGGIKRSLFRWTGRSL